jgi:RHS repeat-associated protein
VDCPFRFPGQSFDDESGLSYNRYRYYDPQCGRYISPDPLGIDGGLNLYQYSINPARWIDPFGLAVCPVMYERYKKFRELGFSPKDAKALAEHPTNVVSPQRTAHILIGDATGGGHMHPPQPGKTGFPPGWDASKIMHEVSDIATSPTSTFTRPDGKTDLYYKSGKPARFTGTETRDGVPIKVVTEPAGEGVITAHPI